MFGYKVSVHFSYGETIVFRNVDDVRLREGEFIADSEIHDEIEFWPSDYITAFEVVAETGVAEAFQ